MTTSETVITKDQPNICLIEITDNGSVLTGTAQHGSSRFQPSITLNDKFVTQDELLSVADAEKVFVVDEEVSITQLWHAYVDNVLSQADLDPATTLTIVLVPSWVLQAARDKIIADLSSYPNGKLVAIPRPQAISQAYSEGISASLASSGVAVIEVSEDVICYTATRRQGLQWQTGVTFAEEYSAEDSVNTYLDWIFSHAEAMFQTSQGVLLVDADEKFTNQIIEQSRLLGKQLNVQPVQSRLVPERLIAEYSAAREQADAAAVEPKPQPVPLPAVNDSQAGDYVEVMLHPGYADQEVELTQKAPFFSSLWSTVLKIVAPFVVIGIIAGVGFTVWHFSSRKKPTNNNDDQNQYQASFEPTSQPDRGQSSSRTLDGIHYTVPAGWRIHEPENERLAHFMEYVYDSTKPWEIVQVTVLHQPYSPEKIKEKVRKDPKLSHLHLYGRHGKWLHYSYQENRKGSTPDDGSAQVNWHVLVDKAKTVLIGCVIADSSLTYPECNEIVSSIN